MTQRDRWLACDGYTIELEEGHLTPLQDLHTIPGRRQRLPLSLRVWALINRLVKPSATASFRCLDFDGERRVGADAQTGPRTAPATAGYRTDAALGHLAGEEAPAAVQPVRTARPDDSAQIAA